MRSTRQFLERRGFLEVLSPVFEPFTDTGVGDAGLFEIDYYGKTYKLMSALTIHKPLLVTQLGNVFSFAPCSRKEPIDHRSTKRHLSQFYQIEVELEGNCEKAMSLLERLTRHIINRISLSCKEELQLLERKLTSPALPFRRITYHEALEAQDLGADANPAGGITWTVEEKLSRHMPAPFFITRFPTSISHERGILYKSDGDCLLDFDLIMPEGHGEVSSGSERETEYERIAGKIRPDQMDSCRAYLDLLRSGLKKTSGFGIGVERLTKYLCGLSDISEASFFPKIPGVA